MTYNGELKLTKEVEVPHSGGRIEIIENVLNTKTSNDVEKQ